MTVLVTGGAGFVGRPLCDALLARGETVRVLDLADEGVPGTEHLKGSIIDADIVQHAMVGVSCVFHLAGNAQLWAPDPGVFDIVNRAGTDTVLVAAEAARVERFVHCSSLTTLIGRRNPQRPIDLDETQRLKPDDMLGAYPRSKLLAERAAEAAAARGFNAVIALPTEPLGPGDVAITPPTRMLIDFLNGANPAYVDAILNFVPVQSLAEGLLACADKGRAGERYLLGGENIEMGRLLASRTPVRGAFGGFPVTRSAIAVSTAPAARATAKGSFRVGIVRPVRASSFARRRPLRAFGLRAARRGSPPRKPNRSWAGSPPRWNQR
ncbi:MAG: NAD-dependent epimerase/dehydratase family protein [Pseudomonadota bacterium]